MFFGVCTCVFRRGYMCVWANVRVCVWWEDVSCVWTRLHGGVRVHGRAFILREAITERKNDEKEIEDRKKIS